MVNMAALKVSAFSFEQVDEFKYLSVNINTQNNMHSEIQFIISSANKGYFEINEMLRSIVYCQKLQKKSYILAIRNQ